MSAEHAEWWGFSQEHEWVVLDRADPRNIPGAPVVHFLRCSDSAEIAIPRDEWERPRTTSAMRYLESIVNVELRALAERQLQRFQKQYEATKSARLEKICRDLHEQQKVLKKARDDRIAETHRSYLVKSGLPPQRVLTLSGTRAAGIASPQ